MYNNRHSGDMGHEPESNVEPSSEGGQELGSAVHYIGPKQMINKIHYIRLLEQSLNDLGYGEIASALERVSVRLLSRCGLVHCTGQHSRYFNCIHVNLL